MLSVETADAFLMLKSLYFPDYRFLRSEYNIRRDDIIEISEITESELDEEELDTLLGITELSSLRQHCTPVDPSTYISLVFARDALDANEEDREAAAEISPFLLCRIKAAIRSLTPQMAVFLNPCAAVA